MNYRTAFYVAVAVIAVLLGVLWASCQERGSDGIPESERALHEGQ